MKNLHKKKVNVLGKKFSLLLVLGVAAIALASAALVPYLSNTLAANVEVESPLELRVSGYSAVSMNISDGSNWGEDVNINMPAYGGESAQLNVSLRNNANEEIPARAMAIWKSETTDLDVSREDFEIATAKTYNPSDDSWDGPYDMSANAVISNDGSNMSVCYGPSGQVVPAGYDPGEINNSEPTVIDLKLATNIAPGNYTFEIKMVPPEECPNYSQ